MPESCFWWHYESVRESNGISELTQDTNQVTQGGRGWAPDQAAAGQQWEAEGGHREAEQEDGQRVGQVLE